MNTLQNHVLLYDEDCPLCQWYSNLFINNNLLDSNGRESYITAVEQNKYPINPVTAQNKIALVNTQTHEVFYGADSMVKILGNSFSIIGVLYKFAPINWFIKGLYSFVSFNRKIVIPTDCNKLSTCSPTRNIFWRSYFILFCTIVACLVFTKFVNQQLPFHDSEFKTVALLFVLQIPLCYVACKIVKEPNIYDYLGQVAFINLLLSFMLLVAIAIGSVFNLLHITIPYFMEIILASLAIIAFGLHKKRVRLAGFKASLNVSYVLIIALSFAITICVYIYLILANFS